MKKLLLTTLIVASFGADASSTEWLPNTSGGYSVESLNSGTGVEISTNRAGEPSVYFTVGHPDCDGNEGDILSVGRVRVNGQLVMMEGYCKRGGDMFIFGKSNEGKRFIINQFKSRNRVTVKFSSSYSQTYSAKGFTKAWHSMINDRAI